MVVVVVEEEVVMMAALSRLRDTGCFLHLELRGEQPLVAL